MPEGDTVHLASARLHRALAGSRLTETDFRRPELATVSLAGHVVAGVGAYGKHLFIRTDAGVSLHTHFRLEGSWHLYRPGERWGGGPSHQIRAILRTERFVAVGYRLPVCELLPTNSEPEIVGHLGPDVLGPNWDPEEALRRFRLQPERAIGSALLDQTVIAGPGNVYKSEICFLLGVHPWTPVDGVEDLAGVVDLTKRLMEANRQTGSQITTGDPRNGRSHWVYGMAGKPCRRCQTTIRRANQESYDSERLTYWCPRCQPPASA